MNVLIDASRDGGIWWFPQPAQENDADEPHQGEALANYLRSKGYAVTEHPRVLVRFPQPGQGVITAELLAPYDLVIRANEYPQGAEAYTAAEYEAYEGYVRGGGRLLLISEYARAGEIDGLAAHFGFDVRGRSSDYSVERFAVHSIVQGVSYIAVSAGCGIVGSPVGSIPLAWYSEKSFLDLNGDESLQANEPMGVPMLAAFTYGSGRIVTVCDSGALLSVSQPLTTNIIDWLLE